MQAVQRFAELSVVKDYRPDEVMLPQGQFSNNFFIVFEGEVQIASGGKVRARLRGGDFFGEIGLLQNSNATAQVTARKEFLRFVAHNYTVALELERVSSQRLGRPIFPLSPGNFQPH